MNFDFISDNNFKELLTRDYLELKKCIEHKCIKSTLVLSGSIIEAILTEYFLQFPPTGKTESQIMNSTLNDLLSWAISENVISSKEKDLAGVVKDYRNLIHPGREIRKGEKFSEETANISVSVLKIIVESVKMVSHMTGNSCSGNIDSGCLQIFSQPGTAVAPLGIEVCIFNLPAKFHMLLFSFIYRVLNPTVITAARYTQYSAHHPNRPLPRVVILYKLINQRSLVEMMPKAFFNMSRSVSASLRRFSSSATLPASLSRERTPLPGKLLSPRSRYSLHQRYNSAGDMPNSCASSETFFRSKLNLTALSLNALS